MDRLRHHNPWWGRFLGGLNFYFVKVILPIVFLILIFGCQKEQEEHGWWSEVQFVDSAYTCGRTEYGDDETAYILFTGDHHLGVPEKITVEISSTLGDREELSLVPFCGGPESLINPRIGQIKIRGTSQYIRENRILEVHDNDTITAFSGNRTFPGEDTAYIKPRRRL